MDYLSIKGCYIEWTENSIMLRHGYSGSCCEMYDYYKLMAELGKAEYLEMDTIIKQAAASTSGERKM